MKIRTLALATFGQFVHNKIILVVALLLACNFLLEANSARKLNSMTNAGNSEVIQDSKSQALGNNMAFLGGSGSLLAACLAAYAIGGEMKSGTILAVMARPLHRWQFLVAKYLAVMTLMFLYTLWLLAFFFAMNWVGRQAVHTSWWVLLVYPLVRYAIWAAVALFSVMLLRNAIIGTGVAIGVIWINNYVGIAVNDVPRWIRLPLHVALPLTGVVLDENRFLKMTAAAMNRYPWTDHVTALAYGLNYAVVFLLLAVATFQRRGLTHD